MSMMERSIQDAADALVPLLRQFGTCDYGIAIGGAHAKGTADAECTAATVRRDLVTWTTTGFYNHCALSDLQKMIPLEDPRVMLAAWKEQIRPYPSRLRASIVQQDLQDLQALLAQTAALVGAPMD
jgi:hypothetical protein